MPGLVQIGVQPTKAAAACAPKAQPRTRVFWLQGVTLAWMFVEFGVSAYAAITAHSPAMLAFGADSLVELMSAAVVLLQWVPSVSISELKATRTASVLLFVLALVVAGTALTSLALRLRPGTSRRRNRHHNRSAACYARPNRAEAPGSSPQRKRSLSCGRGAVGHLCLSRTDSISGTRRERIFPYRVVRCRRCAGGSSHPRRRG